MQARPRRLDSLWEQFGATTPTQFPAWLKMFLTKVSALITEESSHAGSLFGIERSPDVLNSLLQHALTPLSAPLTTRTVELSKESPVIIAEIFLVSTEFARTTFGILSGCSSQNIMTSLSALFSGFSTYMDMYGTHEFNFLQMSLFSELKGISFDVQDATQGLWDQEEGDGSGLALGNDLTGKES